MTDYGTTIDRARDAAYCAHPYYSAAINRLRIVEDPNVPTMATSAAWVTHYNPATLRTWTAEEAGAVLVHEVEHLLRQHHERCGDRDRARWNTAGDAEINQRLNGLPEGAVYPSTLGLPNGNTAETYYGAAPQDDPEDRPEDGPGDPQDGSGGSGDPHDCGSSAGGDPRPWEAGDPTAPTAESQAAIRQDVAQSILAGVGTGDSDELREWAETALGIDRSRWYSALSTAVGHTLSSVGAPTRWRWPGRRDPRDVGGAVLPRWTGERPSCAVVIDTSASITPGDLDMARAAGHFLGRMADVVYYGCNTRVTRYGSVMPDQLYGSGGTDLRRGIEAAIEDGARAVVVITDCMTWWPDSPTRVPVIVGANAGATQYVLGKDASMAMYTPPEWIITIPIIPGP